VLAAEEVLAGLRGWADQVTALADLVNGRGSHTPRMGVISHLEELRTVCPVPPLPSFRNAGAQPVGCSASMRVSSRRSRSS
jgi:hypothetical protein